MLALPNDYAATHPEHGKDDDRSYQTQDPAENVRHGNDFDVDIQIRVHILTFRIAGGGREYITICRRFNSPVSNPPQFASDFFRSVRLEFFQGGLHTSCVGFRNPPVDAEEAFEGN